MSCWFRRRLSTVSLPPGQARLRRRLFATRRRRICHSRAKALIVRCGPPLGWAAPVFRRRARPLRDASELAVLRLVDAEHATADVAALREADGEAEQRLLDVRLRDLPADLRAGGLAVLAGPVDRPADDLRRDVARRAEEVAVAAVRSHVRLDRRVGRLHREERVVHAGQALELRREEAVGAHQLDAALARLPQLLTERLSLRRELPRDVDELRVARDLRDQGGEVGLLLADAVTRGGHTGRLQLRLDLVAEAGRVGLLVVDDVDLL